jgi:phosphomannomutase
VQPSILPPNASPAKLKSSADGWRGIIGNGFTPGTIRELVAIILRQVVDPQNPTKPAIVVSYDSRIGGVAAAEAVVCAIADVGLACPTIVPHLPTPTASFLVKTGVADIVFLITASHNAATYNGLKVKVRPGCPLDPAVEQSINDNISRDSDAKHRTSRCPVMLHDSAGDFRDWWVYLHIRHVLSKLKGTPKRRRRVVVDGLGGIAGMPAIRLCNALHWTVQSFGCDPKPDFDGMRPDPSIPACRERAAKAVVALRAELGLVFDGDGDRLYVVDERGRTAQPQELVALLLHYRRKLEYGNRTGCIVVTPSTGTAVRRVAESLSVRVVELPVGFKHLAPMLVDGRADAGVGAVGDMAFVEFSWDRDPFGAVVLLAGLLEDSETSLSMLLDDMRDTADVSNLRWSESHYVSSVTDDELRWAGIGVLDHLGFAKSIEKISFVDGVKFWLDRGQWLLLRSSSTEGGVRIYSELLEPNDNPRGLFVADEINRQLQRYRRKE